MDRFSQKRFFLLLLCLVMLLPALVAQTGAAAGDAGVEDAGAGDAGAAGKGGAAWIIIVRGDIDPGMVTFVRRETSRALKEGAAFLIYEIDTFGGRVDSALQISSFIMSVQGARTVAWVNTN
jgi:membrane-bound serine protease (ClpP class)